MRVVRGLALGLLVLVGAYAGLAWWLGGKTPKEAIVSGVSIGGLDRDAATAALTAGLADHTAGPIALSGGAAKASLAPSAAGLSVDIPATVDGLVGFSLNPRTVWEKLTGSVTTSATVSVNDAAYRSAITTAGTSLRTPAKEGKVAFADGKLTVTMPVEGGELDPDATLEAIRETWPASSTVTAAIRPIQPAVTADEFTRFRKDFGDVAVSGPVTVTAGSKSFPVAVKEFTSVITVKAEGGKLVPSADTAKLVALVQADAEKAGVGAKPKDAVVTFSGSTPKITPSVDGTELDPESISTKVWQAIGSNDRTAQVTTKVAKATFTTEIAKKTLPREIISSFTTNFKPGQPRVTNIQRGAARLNGAYVPPGGTFSLNKWLGQRTPERGYVKAPGINNGRIELTYGGGISQLSTTLFNASWFSGVKLVDWRAHSLYITRYPEGREATLDWWTIDNVFTNTTDAGILILASTTDTSVTVSFKGVKKWDITTFKGPRFNVVAPGRVEVSDPECIPQDPSPGFTVVNTRVFLQKGKEVDRQSITTKYDATNQVVCTKKAG